MLPLKNRSIYACAMALFYLLCATAYAAAEAATPAWGGQEISAAKAAYAPCSACHLDTGAGVVGAFPPLANRVAAIANSESGRQYLVAVVNNGLNGPISVNGTSYAGVMQAFAASMDDKLVGDALNYVAMELGDKSGGDFRLFTPQEVTSLRESFASDGHTTLELRKKLGVQIPELR